MTTETAPGTAGVVIAGQRVELLDTARVYACGITPYDVTHVGHAATFVWIDTLGRGAGPVRGVRRAAGRPGEPGPAGRGGVAGGRAGPPGLGFAVGPRAPRVARGMRRDGHVGVRARRGRARWRRRTALPAPRLP